MKFMNCGVVYEHPSLFMKTDLLRRSEQLIETLCPRTVQGSKHHENHKDTSRIVARMEGIQRVCLDHKESWKPYMS